MKTQGLKDKRETKIDTYQGHKKNRDTKIDKQQDINSLEYRNRRTRLQKKRHKWILYLLLLLSI